MIYFFLLLLVNLSNKAEKLSSFNQYTYVTNNVKVIKNIYL